MSRRPSTVRATRRLRVRRRRLLAGVGVTAAVATVAACGALPSSSAAVHPQAVAATSQPPQTSPTPPTSTLHLTDLRNVRYCEVFLINPGPNQTRVYNTTDKDNCPTAQWTSMDPKAVAKQYHVQSVFKNGQRFWVLDSLIQANTKETNNFNGILATNWGLTTISGSTPPPYTVQQVARTSQWVFNAGTVIYELLAPGGKRYVMQAYSNIVDPTLKYDDLLQLGYRIHPPKGWTYKVEVLDSQLSLPTVNNNAKVIQDELQDSYMLDPNS